MAGLVLAELDATVLATALPTVVGELGGSDQLLWATTAYLVTGTVMMPVLGRLGDLLGRRPVFLAALAVLVAGSVLGGLAVDPTTLVAARAVQGLGGGALVVLVYAVLADLVPARRRAPVMTAVGAVFAAVCGRGAAARRLARADRRVAVGVLAQRARWGWRRCCSRRGPSPGTGPGASPCTSTRPASACSRRRWCCWPCSSRPPPARARTGRRWRAAPP